MSPAVACPVCRVPLPASSTACPDCGDDLAALVHVRSQAALAYNTGLQLAQDGDLDGAARTLEGARRAGTPQAGLLVLLGKVQAQRGRFEAARAAWNEALALAPDDAAAKAGLARLDELDREEAQHQAAAAEATAAREQLAAKEAASAALVAVQRARRQQLALAAAGVLVGVLVLLGIQQLWPRQPDPQVASAPIVAQTPASAAPSPIAGVTADVPAWPPVASPTAATAVAVPTSAPSPLAVAQAPAPSPVASAAASAPSVAWASPTSVATAPAGSPVASVGPTTPEARPVADLRPAVRAALAANPGLRSLSLDVEQDGPTIRLAGQVPTVALRYAAERAAREVPGVGAVDPGGLGLGRYVVRSGDTLESIALRVYGSAAEWRTIADKNQIPPPYSIRVGRELDLP